MAAKRWCIWYGDGKTFTSEDGTPKEAPPWNVQIIAQSNETVGRELCQKDDYYIRKSDDWVGVDLVGLIDHLAEEGIVKVGRALPTEQFRAIAAEAIKDNGSLPRKSAWLESGVR